jgi:anti-sigma regulatory factor (Ser/Thr protein kinase)
MIFKAQIESLPKIMAWLREKVEHLGFDRSSLNKIELATEEAIVNIITHGNTETLEVEVEGKVQITIRDFGPPFNPLEKKQPDLNAPLEERQVGGLGIHLLLESMDEVYYQRLKNGNQLTLIKKLTRSSQTK